MHRRSRREAVARVLRKELCPERSEPPKAGTIGLRREVLGCLRQCVAKLKMELNEIAIVNASLIPWDERGVKGAIVNQEEEGTSFCKSRRY